MRYTPSEALNERFERWFQEEMPRLYRYLCYRTRDRSSAEEITSRACEKALTQIGQYDPARGELRVWLFGIVRNELRLYFRDLQHQPALISLDGLPDFSLQAPTPEQEYQRKEAFTQLIQTLREFPEREQELIALRYGAALPVQEIAGILGLSENNASVLLHRTLDKLRKSQQETLHEGK